MVYGVVPREYASGVQIRCRFNSVYFVNPFDNFAEDLIARSPALV